MMIDDLDHAVLLDSPWRAGKRKKRGDIFDCFDEAHPLETYPWPECGDEPAREPPIADHEHAAVAPPPDQPPEALPQLEPHDHVLIGVAAKRLSPRPLENRRLRPGHPIENDEP